MVKYSHSRLVFLFCCLLWLLLLGGCQKNDLPVSSNQIPVVDSQTPFSLALHPFQEGTILNGVQDKLLVQSGRDRNILDFSDDSVTPVSELTVSFLLSGDRLWLVQYEDGLSILPPSGEPIDTGVTLLHLYPDTLSRNRIDLAELDGMLYLRADTGLYRVADGRTTQVYPEIVWRGLCRTGDTLFAIGEVTRQETAQVFLYTSDGGEWSCLGQLDVEGTASYTAPTETGFLLCTDIGLYQYDGSTLTRLAALVEHGVRFSETVNLTASSDVRLLTKYGYYTLEQAAVPDEAPRYLDVGYIYYDDYVPDMLAGYNSTHSGIVLREKSYDSYDVLTLDLLSGNGPDLICLGGNQQQLDRYAEKGLLLPLTDILRELTNPEDYFYSVLFPSGEPEELYYMTPYFQLSVYAVPSVLLGDRTRITTLDELDEILSGADAHAYDHWRKSDVFQRLVLENISGLIDYSSGTAHFQTGKFRDILVYSNRFLSDSDPFEPESFALPSYEGIYSAEELYGRKQVFAEYTPYGMDFSFIPEPMSEHTGLGINGALFTGIAANTEDRDAAISVLAYMLSDAFQSQAALRFQLPVLRSALPKMADSYDVGAKYDAELLALIERADHFSASIYDPIQEILLDEAEYYFSGAKSLDEVMRLVQDRAELYLAEQE